MFQRRFCFCLAVLLALPEVALFAQTSVPFSMPMGAAAAFASGNASGNLNTGFAQILPSTGSAVPEGFAIFSLRENGVVVSEATVPASPLSTTPDSFFVEVAGSVNTGVAIANPNPQPATISFGFSDPVIRNRPQNVNEGSFSIPPNSQIARFITQSPFNLPAPYSGFMSVTSSIPVAVTALRGLTNERSEFLMTTVPEGRAPKGTFFGVFSQPRVVAGYIPRFADGGGWKSEIVVVNDIHGEFGAVTLDFLSPSGDPITVTINGQTASSFDFDIHPGDLLRVTTDGKGTDIRAGYVRVVARAHSSQFHAFALYTFNRAGVTVSTSGLPMVQPATAFRMFVEESGNFPGQQRTGIAISNPSSTTATVFLDLTDLTGKSIGTMRMIQIPPFGQLAKFLREIPGFESMPFPFRGVLRITTNSSQGVTASGIRGRLNERSDFLQASILPAVEGVPTTADVIPHVAQGAGYQTEVVVFNNSIGPTSSGTVNTVSNAGSSLSLSSIP